MRTRPSLFYLFAFSLFCLLSSCTPDSSIDRSTRCEFTFSYQDYPTSQLFVAAQNPGCYVFVSTRGDGKQVPRRVTVQSNVEGAVPEENIISNALLNNLAYFLGTNNDIGLIIGMTNFNGLRAYDRCCPSCDVQRALQWTGNRQKVRCNECQRVYDLETAAIVEGAEGSPLRRFNCVFNGVTLRAWN